MTIFEGKGCWTTKINIAFSMGNGVPNIVLKFFLRKSSYQPNESQKPVFKSTFSPISVVLLGQLLPKTIGLTHGWTNIYRVNFMKISPKLWHVSCVLIRISTLWTCNQGPSKTKNMASLTRPLLKSRVSE